jgi:Mechanosensitive ion channel
VQVLQVVGVNVQPLLAAGGVSGIALGFGAQKLTQNVLSGAKLFLTQPFVVGERVRLLGSGGGEVVSGIIETVRRRPCSVPSVHLPPHLVRAAGGMQAPRIWPVQRLAGSADARPLLACCTVTFQAAGMLTRRVCCPADRSHEHHRAER